MKIRFMLAHFILGSFIAATTYAAEPGSQTDPATMLKATTQTIFSEVNERLNEYTENPVELEALVQQDLIPMIDTIYSARLILGREGRGLEQRKINDFAGCMSNLLVSRYAKGLLRFRSNDQLQVLPQRGELNQKLTKVRTRIKLPQGGFAPVDYAFHMTPDGWKAFDVIVEGISYVTTFRNQIMPEVREKGIDSVIRRLGNGEIELSSGGSDTEK